MRKKLLTIVIFSQSWMGAQVAFTSQNTLHLSDNTNKDEKRKFIKAQNGKHKINLLQEVMKSADLAQVTPGMPGDYLVQSTGLKGQSSYKERYAIIFDKAYQPVNMNNMVDYPDASNDFSRAPSGTMLTVGTSQIWFVDLHAIFGKSIGLRRAEAGLMATVYNWFAMRSENGMMTDKIIIAGDWNLPAGDTGFTKLKALSTTMKVLPNVDSSLTKDGNASEAYDHFVWDSAKVSVTETTCDLIDISPKTTQWFRKNVSDHRGITCSLP